ncbi:MAG: zinc ribbon domain-containing protein [Thaumarchaeota archaeon]|nr:zinc ribbon domain-containing protein [Nitrososphaerota archaeon]
MFCSNCGAPNPDGVAFCSKCGTALGPAASSPAQASQSGFSSPASPTVVGKNKFVAAILNLFWGIGYLYLGYKKVLGMRSYLFVVVIFIIDVVIGIFTFGIVSLLIALVLAYDGYVKASGKKGFISAEPALLSQP